MNTFERLQSWYVRRCNDLWEHSYGITIDNIDNPGWQIKIDLKDTYLQTTEFANVSMNCNETDWPADRNWYSCKKDSDTFSAACGPLLLETVLKIFLDWAELHESIKT